MMFQEYVLCPIVASLFLLPGVISARTNSGEKVQSANLSPGRLSPEDEAFYRELVLQHSRILLLDPSDADAYAERGSAKLRLGQYQGAVRDFNEALQRKPGNAMAHCSRAYAKWLASSQGGEARGAAEDYARAQQTPQKATLQPVQKPAAYVYYLRGEQYQYAREYDLALSDYNKAILLNSEYPRAFQRKAEIHFKLGNSRAALEEYSIAIQLDPLIGQLFVDRAAVKSFLKDYTGAMADLDSCLSSYPDDLDARYHRGRLRELAGDLEGAIEDYGFLTEGSWWSARAYVARSNARRLNEDYAGALADADAAVEESPGNAPAYIALGNARADAGFDQEALEAFERALELEPESAAAYRARALAKSAAFELEPALADLCQAAVHGADDAETLVWISLVQRKLGRDTAAAEYARKAIAVSPKDQMGYLRRAQLKLRYESSGSARQDCQEATEMGPSLFEPRVYFYALSVLRGEAEEAREIRMELANALRGVEREGWDVDVARFLAGSISDDALACTSYSENGGRMQAKRCLMYCILGCIALERHDYEAAASLFDQALTTRAVDEFSFDIAAAGLAETRKARPRQR